MNAQPEVPNLVRGWLTLPRRLRRMILWMPLVVLILPLLAINRFCFSGLYFLSEQAAIDAWVDQVISQRTVPVQLPNSEYGTITRYVNVIPYHDRADFYRRNPNCCYTNLGGKMLPFPGPPPMDQFDFWFGKAAYIVSATWVVNYRDAEGTAQSTTVSANGAVTNCGRAWRGY
jgi:hypothetical protein